MAKIKIQQVKSRINSSKNQKRVLDSLGLHRMNNVVEHEDTPAIRGMIAAISHMVKIVD